MIFKAKRHNSDLYNTLLQLSRNIFFYEKLLFEDTYETRIYLMFFHYSIILYIQKKRGDSPDQENYNHLFFYIENNLRELGFGDVAVNKRMKDLNKIFYDILIKLIDEQGVFNVNKNLILKYFKNLKNNDKKYSEFKDYLNNFYKFCFDKRSNNMIKEIQIYKY